jgi:glucokinase
MHLSIDIGGTHIRFATSRDGKKIDHKEKFHTPKMYDDGIDLIEETVERMTDGHVPANITLGAASPIDYVKGVIMKPPALPNWAGHSIRKELELRLKTKIQLENDACLAALAEARAINPKKYPIVAYITLSTGVGGARVVNGRIDYHSTPFEPGHQILDPDGRFWPGCGQRGCFESMASGRAFEITYGVKPELCEDFKIWEEHAQTVSQGLVNVITLWSPDILILGGSLVKAGKKFIDPLMHFTINDLQIFPAPKIVISKMDDNNVLLGGFALQSQKKLL